MDRLFSPSEVSRIAGIARSTVDSLLAYGHLKATPSIYDEKMMISESELLRFCDTKWKKITDPRFTGKKFRMFSPDEVRRHLKEI